ncbi:RecQ family ATP-dependent DNA helicase [Latilactobacillus graminis]|uniref:ATP-dependent DNA helicase RecQ n=2 Tax=Latilactobacillus graminis TaxID=60519 RepID=A0AA89I1G3_9LACO|nr:ATP-dependent DNA helicase RecQ [Latilactobacillus graminis]KRM23788.1 ATP-dependent DNA helicase, RecQ family protein [Latilactobacillus graminis DSM 20719]QFP79680.1 ATP-dependent DNA helicase RecQ [Latilactobacillus graminis]
MITDELIYKTLKDRFGYDTFKPGQLAVIRSVLAGQATLAVLPTGTGKSLCYQLPVYLLGHTTVIVSPLIALMQDQVAQLNYQGEKRAVAINSSLEPRQKQLILGQLSQYRFVFMAPETISQPTVIQALQQCQIDLLVIDEAHCISQWGIDFRPDYLVLATIKRQLKPRATLALTATANAQVRHDILTKLDMQSANSVITSVDRPNIYLGVSQQVDEASKNRFLKQLVMESQGPGIIYFSSRQKTVEIATLLQETTTLKVAYYHAALSTKERFTIQQQFMQGHLDVICATNAFGMGINKADIRYVIHYHLPQNIESYLQEVGRAGRDGKPAYALLLATAQDMYLQQALISFGIPEVGLIQRFYQDPNLFKGSQGNEFELLRRYQQIGMEEQAVSELLKNRQKEKQFALQTMLDFLNLHGCRRQFIVNYFDEDPRQIEHDDQCCGEPNSTAFLEKLNLKKITNDKAPKTAGLDHWNGILKQLF